MVINSICEAHYLLKRAGVFGTLTRLRPELFRVRIPAWWDIYLFFFKNKSRSSLGPNHLPTEWALRIIPSGKAAGAWVWPLTGHLAQIFRMSGAIPPSLLYASMAWRTTTSLLKVIPATTDSTPVLYCLTGTFDMQEPDENVWFTKPLRKLSETVFTPCCKALGFLWYQVYVQHKAGSAMQVWGKELILSWFTSR